MPRDDGVAPLLEYLHGSNQMHIYNPHIWGVQGGAQGFKVILGYVVSSRQPGLHTLCLKEKSY